jgi:1-acyl-sn-glycerol-3-phosphate acyltransferase
MPSASTLVELLRLRAAENRILFTFLQDGETDERHLRAGELDRQARAIAATLQDFKSAGGRALLLYPPGLDYIAAFFGCLYAGVVAVPVYPPDPGRLPRTLPRLQAIARDAEAKIVLTTGEILSFAEALFEQTPDLKRLRWIATESLPAEAADSWKDPAASPDSPAFLQYTSGSTGAPKGVMLTHRNLLHNLEQIRRCSGHTPRSRSVVWLPVYHDMGLIGGILQAVYGGFQATLISPVAFLQRPFRWLQAISRTKAHFSAAPNFAFDLCVRKVNREERDRLDLSSLEVVFCGAEPVRAETLERFADYFAPCGFRREVFYPCYGLAEATLIVSGGKKNDPPVIKTLPNGKRLVGCGRSLEDQRIVIADPETLKLRGPGETGEIWVSGPSVAQGYWKKPKETEETFRAFLKETGEGPFLRTGDLGFLEDGELFVTGRIKDLILIRGQNHYAEDIEQTVEKSDGRLRPGCGAAFSIHPDGPDGEERLAIVQEVDTRTPIDGGEIIGRIRQRVYEFHEIQAAAVTLIAPRSLPKTSSGKVQRYACREAFLAGELEVVEAWKEKGALTATSSLALDLGLDSLTAIEFWTAIEKASGISIPEEKRFELKNLGQVSAYLEANVPPSSGVDNAPDWTALLDTESDEKTARRILARRPRLPGILLAAFRKILPRFASLEVHGLEHLPAEGPYILASNHVSALDYLLVASSLPPPIRKNLVVMAREDYYGNKPLRKFFVDRFTQAAVIDTVKTPLRMLRLSAHLLRGGKILLFYPETIRSVDGRLLPFKNGAALLADYVQCPIVPVYIRGAHEFLPRGAFFPKRRGAIEVILGEPLLPNLHPHAGPPTELLAKARELTEKLRERMLALERL